MESFRMVVPPRRLAADLRRRCVIQASIARLRVPLEPLVYPEHSLCQISGNPLYPRRESGLIA